LGRDCKEDFLFVTRLHRRSIVPSALGKLMDRALPWAANSATKRHGCPSHGVGFTPNEKEIWVCDAANSRLHIFDATVMPPRQTTSIALREQPGWITFSIDGQFAFPSTGEIIDAKTKEIVTALRDERGREVHSEKMLEIVFKDGLPILAGDQFGLGRREP
jgi:hypothetical protein